MDGQSMHDVIIVGAGPAGATTARYLSAAGIDTCLIDKDNFPRDKPCGGGFSQGIVEDFPYLKVKEKDFLKGICKVGVIHSPNRRIVLQGNVDMAVALRTDFDSALLESAIETGSQTILATRVKSVRIKSDKVHVDLSNGSEITSRVLIGCDGVSSTVARSCGLHTKWKPTEITACRVAEIPANETTITNLYGKEKKYHFYANLGGLPGYGWIFPKQETINVGLGIVGKFAQGLPSLFDQFIKLLKHEKLLMTKPDLSRAKGALVPTGGTLNETVSDRCLLVGDSAGMVSPLTGGGIAYAMRAGRYAAAVLKKRLEDDRLTKGDLDVYQTLWMNDFGKDIPNQLLAQKIFTGPLTDTLFEIGRRDEKIQQLVSDSMAESTEDIDIFSLVSRTLLVCIREAFRI